MCTNCVFRCFRTLERLTDRVTGAAGPVFVTLAVCLLSMGVFCFFEVIQPTIQWPLLTVPIDALIAFNLLAHYYFSCTVAPGFIEDPPRIEGEGILWAKRRQTGRGANGSVDVQWSDEMPNMTRAHLTRCRRCGQLRPDRAHHCRVCNHCVLKYDHHCPVRINQCVGVYNERHFVLFMVYLVLSTFCFAVLGYEKLWESMSFYYAWTHWTPAIMFSLIYILSVVLCFAVSMMLGWHLWSSCTGETSVESHDHDVYRKAAKERGQTFENSYDLGKLKNLELFFNTGRDGYPYYTLLLPLRVMPYTDGRSWARRPGYHAHKGIQPGEELTDEDDDY